MNRNLILLTAEYPYGKGETYLENEIKYLSSAFQSIYIISNAVNQSQARPVPANVKVLSRSYGLSFFQKLVSVLCFFSTVFWQEIFFARRVYRQKINGLVVNTILQSILKSYLVEKFLQQNIPEALNDNNTLCYSYWSDDNAVSLALMRKRGYTFRAICRAHRWDVYFEKNGSDFLPFRQTLALFLNAIYFVAEDGLNYFKSKTKIATENLKLSRLGVYPIPSLSIRSSNESYHLVSCSAVIERKRVHTIAEALHEIDSSIQIRWTHIGDGPGMSELRVLCSEVCELKHNIRVDLKGTMSNEEVKQFYSENFIDGFVNVSESEGIPVSIMEAMSASVPAIATDVDGNGEIVKSGKNGFLIPRNFEKNDLTRTIRQICLQTEEEKQAMRRMAYAVWQSDFNAEKNYSSFVKSILSL